MREAGPVVAIVALLITLGGALYGWAATQGTMQANLNHLERKVTALEGTVNQMSSDFNGTRLEITRWMAAHDRADRADRGR
jgi:outer membrane murein-binding lipoprotein Lpp